MDEGHLSDVRLRALRFALDPTASQRDLLTRHAGTARWAYNHALAAKFRAFEHRNRAIQALAAAGVELADARKRVAIMVPSKPAIQKAWNQIKGDDRVGAEGVSPWWHQASTYAFQSAFLDADTAWRNWWDSRTGKRARKPLERRPRFKAKHHCRDSFRIHHDVNKPTIRPDGYRRVIVPRIGSIRVSTAQQKRCAAPYLAARSSNRSPSPAAGTAGMHPS
jgi:putative transposase